MSAGYSQTPLVRKLGIKEGFQICTVGEPGNYLDLLEIIPPGMQYVENPEKNSLDFIHIFSWEIEGLEAKIVHMKGFLKNTGMIWVFWPKLSSGLETNLNGNIVRSIGLSCGLVDVKVCAINEIWSALKFVYRVKDR